MKLQFDDDDMEPLVTKIALGGRLPKPSWISCAIGMAALA